MLQCLLQLLGFSLLPVNLGWRLYIKSAFVPKAPVTYLKRHSARSRGSLRFSATGSESATWKLRSHIRKSLAFRHPALGADRVEALALHLESLIPQAANPEDFNRLLHRGSAMLMHQLSRKSCAEQSCFNVDQVTWEWLNRDAEWCKDMQNNFRHEPMKVLRESADRPPHGSGIGSHEQTLQDIQSSVAERLQNFSCAAAKFAAIPRREADIGWCRKQWQAFFEGRAAYYALRREMSAYRHRTGHRMPPEKRDISLKEIKHFLANVPRPFRLLDVGSSVNSFKIFEEVQTTAIDLLPKQSDVLQCDILQLQIGPSESQPVFSEKDMFPEQMLNQTRSTLVQLPAATFDVAICSLILGFLPEQDQRVCVIQKVKELMGAVGLVLVVEVEKKNMQISRKILDSMGFTCLCSPVRFGSLLAIAYAKLPDAPWNQSVVYSAHSELPRNFDDDRTFN